MQVTYQNIYLIKEKEDNLSEKELSYNEMPNKKTFSNETCSQELESRMMQSLGFTPIP